jgi:hypothetical protein
MQIPIMDCDVADLKETSQSHSSSASNDPATANEKAEQSRQLPGPTESEVDGAEPEQPSQLVRTLGKMRFRPADDDEPQ